MSRIEMVAQFLGRRRSGLHRDTMGSMVASWQLFRSGRARSSWGGEDRDSIGTRWGARWLRGNCSGAEERAVLGAAKIGIQRDTNDGARWLHGNCSGAKEHRVLGAAKIGIPSDRIVEHGGFVAIVQGRRITEHCAATKIETLSDRWLGMVAWWQLFRGGRARSSWRGGD